MSEDSMVNPMILTVILFISRFTILESAKTQIATLGSNTCILSGNEIKCHGDCTWGINGNGCQNQKCSGCPNSYEGITSPPAFPIFFGDSFTPKQLSCGYIHCCTASTQQTSKCWGANYDGRLGLGDTIKRGTAVGEMGNNLPILNWGSHFAVEQIACGFDHTCALSTNHEVKCIGHLGSAGKLGDGGIYTDNVGDEAGEMGDGLVSVDLGTDFETVYIECGNGFSCALSSRNAVKCWGYNSGGQLGQEDYKHRGAKPDQLGDFLHEINFGTNVNATKLRVGKYHICAITSDNQLRCWGSGGYGQLGRGNSWSRGGRPGDMGDAFHPVDLGKNFVPIDATLGATHTCALSTSHNVKCFGYGYYGQLGYERGGFSEIIGRSVNEMGDYLNSIALGMGFEPKGLSHGCWTSHNCVFDDIQSDPFSMKCFGQNDDGALGYGDGKGDIGDSIGEMGDNLPFIDHGFGASSPVAAAGADSDSFDDNVIGKSASRTDNEWYSWPWFLFGSVCSASVLLIIAIFVVWPRCKKMKDFQEVSAVEMDNKKDAVDMTPGGEPEGADMTEVEMEGLVIR